MADRHMGHTGPCFRQLRTEPIMPAWIAQGRERQRAQLDTQTDATRGTVRRSDAKASADSPDRSHPSSGAKLRPRGYGSSVSGAALGIVRELRRASVLRISCGLRRLLGTHGHSARIGVHPFLTCTVARLAGSEARQDI